MHIESMKDTPASSRLRKIAREKAVLAIRRPHKGCRQSRQLAYGSLMQEDSLTTRYSSTRRDALDTTEEMIAAGYAFANQRSRRGEGGHCGERRRARDHGIDECVSCGLTLAKFTRKQKETARRTGSGSLCRESVDVAATANRATSP